MTGALIRPVLALCALASCALPIAAQHWQMQYFYDEARSSITIQDLQFPSASRGVAVGAITARKSQEPVALVTSDGGAHWQTLPLKENPISLFFLNDSIGWMVTDKGLWRTAESGKSWTKLPKIEAPVLRVYFADEKTGWAVGAAGTAWETHDGAQHWNPLPAANGNPPSFTYRCIAFATPQAGLILGSDDPMHNAQLPGWLDPDDALTFPELSRRTVTLETLDGGKTWRSGSVSQPGRIMRARFAPPAQGIGLIEHVESDPYPSDVWALLWPAGGNEMVFRDKDFFVSDVWITPQGRYYLAGVTLVSRLRDVVPQKVKVLTSRDLKEWKPLAVDYRAAANRVILAGSGGGLWIATNNGMILKLAP